MYCIYTTYTSKQFSECSPTHTKMSLDQEFGSTLKWGQTSGELASLHKPTPFLDTFLEQEPQNMTLRCMNRCVATNSAQVHVDTELSGMFNYTV